eukprot:1147083-Pelagomonas_calceolata.AAC.1
MAEIAAITGSSRSGWSDIEFWWCKLGFTPRLIRHGLLNWQVSNLSTPERKIARSGSLRQVTDKHGAH